MSRRYTWDGMRTFMKIDTAALHAVDYDKNPYDLSVLVDGQVELAEDWEVDDLLAHMREWAAPL